MGSEWAWGKENAEIQETRRGRKRTGRQARGVCVLGTSGDYPGRSKLVWASKLQAGCVRDAEEIPVQWASYLSSPEIGFLFSSRNAKRKEEAKLKDHEDDAHPKRCPQTATLRAPTQPVCVSQSPRLSQGSLRELHGADRLEEVTKYPAGGSFPWHPLQPLSSLSSRWLEIGICALVVFVVVVLGSPPRI